MTQHTCGGPVFGKRTPGCPRCDELAAGAPRRTLGWVERRKQAERDEQRRCEAIKRHVCTRETCGIVCTRFEW